MGDSLSPVRVVTCWGPPTYGPGSENSPTITSPYPGLTGPGAIKPPVLTAGAVLTSAIGAVLIGPGAATAKGWVASLELTTPDVVVVGAAVRVLTVPEVPETVLEVV